MKEVRPKVSEVNRLLGDNSLLKSLTKWEPDFSGIEGFKDGLKLQQIGSQNQKI